MPKLKAHYRASRIALAVIWQLVALIPSTHAQTETHATQDDSSDTCTRAPDATGAPVAHFPCLSLGPLSTTAAGATSPLSFSLSPQETSSTPSSSVTILQSFNSTSDHAVSISTLFTTLRDNDPTTSTPSQEQVQPMNNATLSAAITSNTIRSQNSTTDFKSSVPTTTFAQDGGGAFNATMFPMVPQTVTYTTTMCPSGGWDA